jgi:hypothetical protein
MGSKATETTPALTPNPGLVGRASARYDPKLIEIACRVLLRIQEATEYGTISQRRLAIQAGLNRSTLRRIVEHRARFTLVDYLALCKGLDLDPVEVLQEALQDEQTEV